jgi:hypothetical protein
MVNLQIPLLFDISAGGIVFGETAVDMDVFDTHLNFEVTGSSGAGLITELKRIMYADASENDVSGVLFYSTPGTSLSTSLGQQISYAMLGDTATLIQPSATGVSDASGNAGNSHGARYMTPGIPLPNYSKTTSDTSNALAANDTSQKYYTAALVDAGGSSFGRILIRLMATHLMGHPFAQAFIKNESSIIADISNSDVTTQLDSRLLKNKSTMYAAGSSNTITAATLSGGRYTALKSAGIRNQILQSLYEGLLGTAPERFDLSGNDVGLDVSGVDISGGTDADYGNLDPSSCRPRVLPFEAGDSISFYFRPRVSINIDTSVGGSGNEYGNEDLSGVGQGSASQSSSNIRNIFFNPRHRWISHHTSANVVTNGATTNAAALAVGNHIDTYADPDQSSVNCVTMTGTDLFIGKDVGDHETVGGGVSGNGTMFDGHVWKIKVTMT